MKWTDEWPKIEGWYWRKEGTSEKVMFVTSDMMHPSIFNSWKDRKASVMKALDEIPYVTEEQKKIMDSKPDSHWKIYWYGPIQSPLFNIEV